MYAIHTALAVLCAAAAVLCGYLAAPHQQLLTRSWPGRRSRLLGTLLMFAAFGLWRHELNAATALFALLTLSMALATALPFLAAWWRLRKAGGA